MAGTGLGNGTTWAPGVFRTGGSYLPYDDYVREREQRIIAKAKP